MICDNQEGIKNKIPIHGNRPLFIDVTWTLDAGKRSFETLVAAQAICAVDVQMHLTCTGITRDTADDLLAEAAQARTPNHQIPRRCH